MTLITFKRQSGFTLIEMLIVIAIIGILAAIAIPNFNRYRQNSFNAAAESDLRNTATSEEAYFVDHNDYCETLSNLETNYDLTISEGVQIDLDVSQNAYTLVAFHSLGNKTYTLTGPGGALKSD